MPVESEVKPPSVVILAGPNGAGKSTVAPSLLRGVLAVDQFVNADEIARGLAGFAPDTAAIPAGRAMLSRLKELARNRSNFAFETTLASRSFAPWLSALVKSGYCFHLVFLWLPSAELAIARVADRVRRQGHSVPEETIRRRYLAGLANFRLLYRPIATNWRVYDNSRRHAMTIVARGSGPRVERVYDPLVWRVMQEDGS